jgi:hypothetical protein
MSETLVLESQELKTTLLSAWRASATNPPTVAANGASKQTATPNATSTVRGGRRRESAPKKSIHHTW